LSVGCLKGKGATPEAAAWHDCSLGVINGAGAPAHHVTPGPRAGPWLVELSLESLDVRETHKLQKRCAWCGCRRGAFGVCIPFLSLIGVTVQVLGASRDKLHPELTKHAYCVHLCYQPCPFQQCRHKCMPRHTPREGVRPTIGDQTIAI
jgi:hypothetical protein